MVMPWFWARQATRGQGQCHYGLGFKFRAHSLEFRVEGVKSTYVNHVVLAVFLHTCDSASAMARHVHYQQEPCEMMPFGRCPDEQDEVHKASSCADNQQPNQHKHKLLCSMASV